MLILILNMTNVMSTYIIKTMLSVHEAMILIMSEPHCYGKWVLTYKEVYNEYSANKSEQYTHERRSLHREYKCQSNINSTIHELKICTHSFKK